MKKAFFLIFVCAVCSITISYSQEKLEVEGKIKIGDDASLPEPGTIRYNPSTCDFEGWNGVFWASLTGFRLGSVTDIDLNVYKTVIIGTQEWMVENLRTTQYANEANIIQAIDDVEWSQTTKGVWCWYDNNGSLEQPYGKLYNWFAVNSGNGLCPTGWHVPTDGEWTILTDFLGGLIVAGGSMKEAGTAHWNSPNTGATNSSGFTGLPGGFRDLNGSFKFLGAYGRWWSSTEFGPNGWYRYLSYSSDNVGVDDDGKRMGFSVRCVRD